VAEQAYRRWSLPAPRPSPALLDKVDTADRQQREYVVAALGTLKAPAAVPALGRLLADRGRERRYVAAWALGEIASPDGIPALLGALNDPNSEVRRYATRALIKINRPAVAPLIVHLRNASGKVPPGRSGPWATSPTRPLSRYCLPTRTARSGWKPSWPSASCATRAPLRY